MQLNADLGESFGSWKMGDDEAIMSYIALANVACGYHAGDPLVMQNAIRLAKINNIKIGAHVSYPDLMGFGRRSMRINKTELIPIIHAQIAVLEGLALCQGLSLNHVKPHGAMYNDMMRDAVVFEDIVEAIKTYHKPYPLMIQAMHSAAKNSVQYQAIASSYNVELILEAFADRAYTDEGFLQSRNKPNAVLNDEQALAQARNIIHKGRVNTVSGKTLQLNASTLCVHSDNIHAIELCKKIHALLEE